MLRIISTSASLKLLGAAVACLTALHWSTGCADAGDRPRPTTGPAGAAEQGLAVVELFTSEGCSSCPPADALLAKIAEEARGNGTPVHLLAFHVDYWNHLGWADRFSSPAFSQRQRAYAAARHSDQIYTPQMIVNGTAEFIGSDAKEAQRQIRAALQKPASATISLGARITPEGKVQLDYAVRGARDDAVLNLAVVEQDLQSNVARGENAGRVLHHENVVRSFKTVPLPKDGRGVSELFLPKGVDPHKLKVVAYVQKPHSGSVVGAVAAEPLARE